MSGRIKYRLDGDSKSLRSEADKGKESLVGLKKEYQKNAAEAGKWAQRVAAAGLAISTYLITNALQAVDAQAKLARSLNTTSASLATMERAGELSGVALTSIEQATKDLTRRLSQAAAETGPAVDALERLNLTAEDLMQMPLDERIALINSRIREFIPAAQQAAVAGQLFGEEGSIAMQRIDPETIARAAEEVRVLGTALSEVEAAQIEAANDSFSRLKLAGQGVAEQLAVQLAPVIDAIGQKFWEAAQDSDDLGEAMHNSFSQGVEVVATLADKIQALAGILEQVWQGYESLPAWAKEVGITGAILGGKKGVALLAAISGAAEETKVTAQWFAAWQNGHIGFTEWLTAGNTEAERRLRELGTLAEDVTPMGNDTSIIGTLFKLAPGEEGPESWGNRIRDFVRTAQEDSERAAREAIEFRRMMEEQSGTGEITTGLSSEEMEELEKRARSAFNATRTGVERAQQALEEFRDIVAEVGRERLDEMGINVDEVMKRLQQNIVDTKNAAEEAFGEMDAFADQAARNMQDSLANALMGMETNFTETLRRMAAQATSQIILRSLFNWASGSSNSALSSLGGMFQGSFDGGGYTGAGPRSGGVDGKGGFPAILHPNETVIDHSKGQAAANNSVTIGDVNVTISGPATEESGRRAGAAVAGELVGAMSQSRRYS